MSNFRWLKHESVGLVLQEWFEGPPIVRNGKTVYGGFQGWRNAATVFKANRGERYVIRVINNERGPRFHQYQAFTLREAMRLAKFLVGVKYG